MQRKSFKPAWLLAVLIIIVAVTGWMQIHNSAISRGETGDGINENQINKDSNKNDSSSNNAGNGKEDGYDSEKEPYGGVFSKQGYLAYVQAGHLYVLDGETGMTKQLSHSGLVQSPQWSYDGQWLAYVQTEAESDIAGSLWLVKRDGSKALQVQGLPEGVMPLACVWSPAENQLAVSCQGLWLISIENKATQIVKNTEITPWLAWSPDGQKVAYSATLSYRPEEVQNRSDALFTFDLAANKIQQHLVSEAAGIEPVAWWPNGKGILYREDPGHSASIAADGLELCSYRLGGQETYRFSAALTYPQWTVLAGDGKVLRAAGDGREIWTNKWLELGDIYNGEVQRLNLPAGIVPADPAFSPDQSQIAFVAAPDLGSGVYPGADEFEQWKGSRLLWTANLNGSGAASLSQAGVNIQKPQWSGNGEYILYVSDSSLWMITAAGVNPQKIADRVSDYAWFKSARH